MINHSTLIFDVMNIINHGQWCAKEFVTGVIAHRYVTNDYALTNRLTNRLRLHCISIFSGTRWIVSAAVYFCTARIPYYGTK